MSRINLLRIRIIENKKKIKFFKLNDLNNKIVINHLENENLKLKKLLDKIEYSKQNYEIITSC